MASIGNVIHAALPLPPLLLLPLLLLLMQKYSLPWADKYQHLLSSQA